MVAEVAAPETVRVAVEALADRPERAFSYELPAELGRPAPGSLLLVPYGRRLALGYLLAGSPEPELGIELRAVEAVVSGPMLTPDLLALAEEIAAVLLRTAWSDDRRDAAARGWSHGSSDAGHRRIRLSCPTRCRRCSPARRRSRTPP